MASVLYVITERLVDAEWAKLDRELLTPWAFFHDRGVRLTAADGRAVALGPGLAFDGSAVEVFWRARLTEGHLEAIADLIFQATVQNSTARSLALQETLQEAAGLLKSISFKAYSRMATLDQRLRGRGLPDGVPKRSVGQLQREIEAFIDRRMEADLLPLKKRVVRDLSGLDL